MESWAIIAIVAIASSAAGGMYRNALKHRNEIGRRVEAQLSDLATRLDKIEATFGKRDVIERLNALEAIVTERGFELRREIDELDRG